MPSLIKEEHGLYSGSPTRGGQPAEAVFFALSLLPLSRRVNALAPLHYRNLSLSLGDTFLCASIARDEAVAFV